MPYITSVERIGIQKGLQQGFQQLIAETLDERFGDIPLSISESIQQIQDHDKLRSLHRQAIRSASIEEFQQQLNGN